uniref:Uncharacterized protein n=1 Tax=viral metagenome TaxID=1070528 RepID=A0A6C0L8S5_9ZZZZ
MSEQKKINIDMNLFKVSNNKTRKKPPGDKKDGGIKIKQPSQKKKNETLKKNSILKMIRQHQQDRYNNLFDEKKPTIKPNESTGFNKEFEEAQKFMQNLTEKTAVSAPKNSTIKQYPTTQTNSLLYNPIVDTFSAPIKDVTSSVMTNAYTQPSMVLKPVFNNPIHTPPQFGCLKNGQLPTYRNYVNKTQKAFQPHINVGGSTNSVSPIPSPKTFTESRNEHIENRLKESMNRVNQMKHVEEKIQQIRSNTKLKKMKRKKTIRRTYKVGKSKIAPKVSVLVSNKTIRNNISTKAQLLKQTPIEEVKKHLMKCGLIRVGTITPNDVLRKMYESSIMMCGDVHNHNPDYLLYNFINGPK